MYEEALGMSWKRFWLPRRRYQKSMTYFEKLFDTTPIPFTIVSNKSLSFDFHCMTRWSVGLCYRFYSFTNLTVSHSFQVSIICKQNFQNECPGSEAKSLLDNPETEDRGQIFQAQAYLHPV